MRYYLIMNPGSKGGKSKRLFKEIFHFLDSNNITYDYKITGSLEEAYRFSVAANKTGYDVIVAVGGDGTINRVINGFYDVSSGSKISNARLGVIYTGTSPDFCKSYCIPIKVQPAVRILLEGKSKKIQIGKIIHARTNYPKYDNLPISRVTEDVVTSYFACCTNIGIGAFIARNANNGIRKYLGDIAGTFISMIKSLMLYRPCAFATIINGDKRIYHDVFNISIGKTTYIASGIKVKNDLQPEDEKFYCLMVRNLRWMNWLKIFKQIYSGNRIVNNNHISLDYVEKIEILGQSENPEIEFDGDPRGFLPCTIECVQYPIELICEVKNE
ncbi:diacylglycerol kinase family protein [Petroclostridium sp. X23]|uniref:diacylglycerol/lipid kinase family protein n=1 Tax=Petroclostridium sp. X23 TaxID=3045146 RepID=UPI0024AC95AF|nr:diacylglycerol kinase family protein [Petroclostridium sp. X23]WHH59475.1 diacylglycerol kinase family protein [Petroclostridium sp. X23]